MDYAILAGVVAIVVTVVAVLAVGYSEGRRIRREASETSRQVQLEPISEKITVKAVRKMPIGGVKDFWGPRTYVTKATPTTEAQGRRKVS